MKLNTSVFGAVASGLLALACAAQVTTPMQQPAAPAASTAAPAVATPPAPTAEASTAASPALPSEASLRERVNAHYKALAEKDMPAAVEYVAPASRKEFFRDRYDALVSAKIESVKIEPSGDSAQVTTMRTLMLPRMGLIDADFTQEWRVINGQWYLYLPDSDKPHEIDTPFGRMPVGGGSDPETMKKMIEERNKHIDPDQYLKALDKAARQMQQNQSQAAPQQGAPAGAAASAPAQDSSTAAPKTQKKTRKQKPAAPAAPSPSTGN
ncbi:MAG TPA: nuclear transport factor 2 family protein [Terriglobales bacterium]|nr:nuclear transport factor 2 family protein [Terriglobales bacterium]